MKITKPKNKQFSFNTLYDNVTKMKQVYTKDPDRYPQFRLSSSPFCPYKFIYNWAMYLEEGNSWDYNAEFFTSVGTSIHNSIQKWLPRLNPGFILGKWKCKHCCKHPHIEDCIKCTKKCKFYEDTKVGPRLCPKCGSYMSYVEFHFIIPPLTSGHCDGIMLYGNKIYDIIQDMEITAENVHKVDKFLLKTKNPIDTVILEYKSTTKSNSFTLSTPKIEHKAQAMMYAPSAQKLLNAKGLNVNVIGSLIKYIARDLPNLTSKDLIVKTDIDYYNYSILTTKLLLRAIKNDDVSEITKRMKVLPCESKHRELYSTCKYKKDCVKLRKELQGLFDLSKKDIKKAFIQFNKKFKTQLEEHKRDSK